MALCGLFSGCSDIASARIRVTADPLAVQLELTGPTPAGWQSVSLPNGGTLSFKSTSPAGTVVNVTTAPAAVAPVP